MSAPPPIYFELASAVEKYLTPADHLNGWSIDATEEPTDNVPQVFPVASNGNIGAHVVYNNTKANVKAEMTVSSAVKSWRELLPLVSYTKDAGKQSFNVEYNFSSNMLSQTLVNPTFFVTAKTAVTDGLASTLTITTPIFEKAFVGGCASFDPKRSGITDATVTAVRYNCPNVGNGDVLAKWSLKNGFGLHVRVPLTGLVDAAVLAEKHRFIAGIQGRSPCGARMMVHTNVNDGTLTVAAIRNLNDIWKLSFSYTSRSLGDGGNGKEPRFGLKLSNNSMLD